MCVCLVKGVTSPGLNHSISNGMPLVYVFDARALLAQIDFPIQVDALIECDERIANAWDL